MLGAIYIGLSGMNAYSQGLQQVSNNISNLNTSGFKSSTVSFADLYGTSDGGGLSFNNSSRGKGNGVAVNEGRIDLKQGELRQTGRDLDLAIDGSGFLVVFDGEELLYSRTGSFAVDNAGYIVLNGTDYRLATLDASGKPVALSVDQSRTSAPKATTEIKFSDNLSSTATTFSLADNTVYDANGGAHVWQIKFDKDTATGPNNWKVTVTDETGKTIGEQALQFAGGQVTPETNRLTFTDTTVEGLSVVLDFSQGVSSFSAGQVSTLRRVSSDGYPSGTIATVTVNAEGRLEIGYSNEQTADLGAIAIADFREPQALEQRGGGLFAEVTPGQRDFLNSEDPRAGQVVARQLEASNVDLSKQFGDLILIQRGFQASSQIVSVSNDMIQQLFGIRGQG